MMMTRIPRVVSAGAIFLFLIGASVRGGGGALPDNDTVMKAMVDELSRSMEALVLDDLPKPYFLQYIAQDRLSFTMRAAYGGLLRSDTSRIRAISSRVRVGSPETDNTNIGRGFGGRASLPIDDDYTALRHAMWLMTDADYKRAVEVLTRKEAYLKQKNIEDRPHDFTPAEGVRAIEPSAEIAFDEGKWEENLKRLSARFKKYPDIQDADVQFFAGAVNKWIVNSEGTRIRQGDTGVYIEIKAALQAEDGMRLRDSLSYLALYIDDLPPLDKMLADVDKLCTKLMDLSHAPVLEHYTGPVLFDPIAAGAVFEALLAEQLCARPIPLGSGGWADRSFEAKIGLRVLPRSFDVYDDPGPETFEGKLLAGSYTFDAEGVRPKRVSLIEKGILKTLLAGRAPTRKIKQTTGHGRSAGFSDAQAMIGCLYVADADGMSTAELRTELIQAAKEEGLPFALRIESTASGIGGDIGKPIYAYKVYVDDGREELVRGMEFLPVEPRSLKRILAAGSERKIYNSTGGIMASVIAPAVLFEELELNKMEKEFDRHPILKSPGERTAQSESETP